MDPFVYLQWEPIQELKRRLGIYIEESRREHDLINNRMTWYVTSQSFLAIAVASAGLEPNALKYLMIVIPVVALLISVLAYTSIWAALAFQITLKNKKGRLVNNFIVHHREDFEANFGELNNETLKIIEEPWHIRGWWVHPLGIMAPILIPPVLMAFWILMLCCYYKTCCDICGMLLKWVERIFT